MTMPIQRWFTSFFTRPPRTMEAWIRDLDRQASFYQLSGAIEVQELRASIMTLLESGRQEELEYRISQVDPYLRVDFLPDQTMRHYESEFDSPVLRPATVFDFHMPHLRDDVNVIKVDGVSIRFYACKKKVASYFSALPLPDALVRWEAVPAIQLITDYTGLEPPIEQFMRMDRAVFERRGRSWFYEIL